MRLWTVQPRAVVEGLERTGLLVGDWKHVEPSWRPAYEVMTDEMRRRGIDCEGRPPVWAWVGADSGEENVLVTARMLLSDEQIDSGVVVLDLDVPDNLVLRSSYSQWNELLSGVLSGEQSPAMAWSIDPEEEDTTEEFQVQACLPMLRRGWVRGIRPINPPCLLND
ncbi:DUF3841 domain-containing protein [Streptomyces coffeae]|uniref:DUF3841 domain-containing protein n=1 Tax=Streptomyces coffeae TaxID=621382 RepID=A0ABS1NRK6_9ACTN|nr:DUF3841 domain-containing protein [Streptomyces coffeae]MBL1102743.1 DUF3841 domain-containing protein [Streptomyces coffeae]